MARGRLLAAIAGALLVLCVPTVAGAEAPAVGQWRVLLEVPDIVDVVGPRADGKLVLATQTGLLLLRPGGTARPFANGPGGYTASGGEPYIALASGSRVWGVRGCSFARGDVFALDAGTTRRRPSGASAGACSHPKSSPAASMRSTATERSSWSPIPGCRWAAISGSSRWDSCHSGSATARPLYFADLGAPGAPTEGTDALLVLRGQDLARASLRPGELLAATEEGHLTFVAGTFPRA
jgi:hypothetical protein